MSILDDLAITNAPMATALPQVAASVWQSLWREKWPAMGALRVDVTTTTSVLYDERRIRVIVHFGDSSRYAMATMPLSVGLMARALEPAEYVRQLTDLVGGCMDNIIAAAAPPSARAPTPTTPPRAPATPPPTKPGELPYPAPLGERHELLELAEHPEPARVTAFPTPRLPDRVAPAVPAPEPTRAELLELF